MESPKTKPKARGKFGLFRCFKHNDVVLPSPKKKGADPLFTYIAVAEKQPRMALPTMLSSAFAAAKGAVVGEENSTRRRKIRKEYNSIRRALVAALNHTPLAKKMSYKRKTNKDSFSTETTSNLSNTTSSSSRSSLAFSPSSLSCSTSVSTTSTGTQASGSSFESYQSGLSLPINGTTGVAKQKKNIGDNNNRKVSNMALCLLLITTLVVLIMWGKFCAIACTSIGFFVVANRWKRPCNDEAILCEETDEFSSVRYNK